MYSEQMHPFVRYVRRLSFRANEKHLVRIPYDARLFYARKGKSIIKANNTEYVMERGDVLIINSDIPYLFINNTDVEYLAINFDYTYNHFLHRFPIAPSYYGEDYNPKDVLEKIIFRDAPALNTVFHAKQMFCIEDTLITMVNLYQEKLIYFNSRLSALMINILIQCLLNAGLPDAKTPAETSTSDAIIRYIHENYNKDLSNKHIGEKFSFHPNYVSNIIKDHTGMPLHSYILYVRISKAIELLDTTGFSITRISGEVGFSSVARFSNHFKRIVGVSPAKYRNTANV